MFEVQATLVSLTESSTPPIGPDIWTLQPAFHSLSESFLNFLGPSSCSLEIHVAGRFPHSQLTSMLQTPSDTFCGLHPTPCPTIHVLLTATRKFPASHPANVFVHQNFSFSGLTTTMYRCLACKETFPNVVKFKEHIEARNVFFYQTDRGGT
jgi:hypothetical protein